MAIGAVSSSKAYAPREEAPCSKHAGFAIPRDAGRIDRAERQLERHAARELFAVRGVKRIIRGKSHGVAGRAISGAGEIFAACEQRRGDRPSRCAPLSSACIETS
jgi:hypothetical protein